MIKKLCLMFLIFTFLIPSCFAYDFVDPSNKSKVYDDRDEIYNLRTMYEEMSGKVEEDIEIEYEDVVTSDSYWWPIGSKDSTNVGGKEFSNGDPETVTITSNFGTIGDVSSHAKGHGGLDIGGGRKGETNIIAAKDGVVVYPIDKSKMTCPDGGLGNTCGGGYGNYVILQHSDGNYTLYGHMYANSITVKAGDTVKQGQVIGKMGTSGDSSGPHLHFEVRVGANDPSKKVDPLKYISDDNPRPSGGSSGGLSASGDYSFDALFEYISRFEGTGCLGQLSEEGDNYIACRGSLDSYNITIGHGVTTNNNPEKFAAKGYPNVKEGDRVPKSVVDDIEKEIIQYWYDVVTSSLAKHGIDSLKDNQIMALVSQAYNGTNVMEGGDYSFVDYWPKYKDTYKFEDVYEHKPSLWYDSLCHPFAKGGGLYRRRVSEWMLFTKGTIDHLESGFDYTDYAWPE